MKKTFNKLLLLSFLFISMLTIHGQDHKLATSFTGGYVSGGFGGMVTVDYKINEFDYIQLNAQANFTKLEYSGMNVPVNLYSFSPGFFYDVLRNNSRVVAISVGGGGTVGYEIINKGDDRLENDAVLLTENKVVFGAYVGLDADVFIIPTIALNIRINEFYHINSDIGKFTPYMGLGVKLILF